MKRRSIHQLVLYTLPVILFSFVVLTNAAAARQDKNSDAGYIFYKGNTLYEQGRYDDAISEYLKLLAQGIESGNLYYNIGNCYFKKGERGKAILNYERAKRLMPRDSDLDSNYKFALSQININTSVKSVPWYEKTVGIFSFLSLDELTVLISVLSVLIIVILITRLFIPLSKKPFILFLSCLIIAFVFTVLSLVNSILVIDREAVVIMNNPEAKYEPFESATTHYTLHEGMKVYLLQSKKDWVKIKRSDGKMGWIRNQVIEKI
jgi:tetratricopeptide (TPR) repeat protein